MNITTVTVACLMLHCLVVSTAVDGAAAASEWQVHHDLTISLLPETAELEGRDRIRIRRSQNGPVELDVAPQARIHSLELNGRGHPYTFDRGRLTLIPDRQQSPSNLDLNLHYTCRFDDPAPVRPANTDNPGYGVSGTISAAGTFILSGAGWYPRVVHARETIGLRIDGPRDTVAVTAGRMVSITDVGNRTVSEWRVDNPLEGLCLSAGPYVVDRQTEAGLTAATFLSAGNRHLAPRYLEASLRYMRQYSDRFGAYPFEAFAVVENFFPTGYGFPGYTLMGGMVLQLPFIPETSLPHEIVHSWWGNGVLVDFASGNWCEGLTTYSADYLLKERTSADAALDYRRQAMRNYASLVSASTEVSLDRFQSRIDPATKAVGYDKAAMVFHMLRQTIGERAFWQALRDLYAQSRFKRASWQDLRQHFERQANRSLEGFFRQWIERPGAPRLHLENVLQHADDRGYLTTGILVQERPFYDVSLDLVLETERDSIRQAVRSSGRTAEFTIRSTLRPRKLVADPDYHLFRQLTREETPATINTLKGSASAVLVISGRLERSGGTMARYFSQAMGLDPVEFVVEAGFSLPDATGTDIVFIGLPQKPEHLELIPGASSLSAEAFELEGQRFSGSSDLLFMVSRPAGRSVNTVSLLLPLGADAADRAIGKIPHYGRYSYLAFSDGHNRIKGTWEVSASPMMMRWDRPETVDQGATP